MAPTRKGPARPLSPKRPALAHSRRRGARWGVCARAHRFTVAAAAVTTAQAEMHSVNVGEIVLHPPTTQADEASPPILQIMGSDSSASGAAALNVSTLSPPPPLREEAQIQRLSSLSPQPEQPEQAMQQSGADTQELELQLEVQELEARAAMAAVNALSSENAELKLWIRQRVAADASRKTLEKTTQTESARRGILLSACCCLKSCCACYFSSLLGCACSCCSFFRSSQAQGPSPGGW